MKKSIDGVTFREHLFFLAPASIIFFIILVIPFALGVVYSFTNWNGISTDVTFIGFQNYKEIFAVDSGFLKNFIFTFKYMALNVMAVNVIGTLLAVSLVQPIPCRNTLRAAFYLPQTLGGLVLGFIWQFIFIDGFPAFGAIFHSSVLQLPWLGTEGTAFTALLIVSIWQNVGYVMVIMTAAFLGVPKEVLESATIDGSSTIRTFFRIKLPMCMPFVTVCLFWTTANAFKMFELSVSLTKGGPYGSTVSMALGIYNEAFVRNKYGLATAESMILFLIILLVTMFQLFLTKKQEDKYR